MRYNSSWRDQLIRYLPIALTLGILLCDTAVFLWFGYRDWPQPWRRLLGEWNAITWLSSVQLVFCGWLGCLTALLQFRFRRPLIDVATWALVGGGFFYLAIDEQFEFHERVQLPFALPGLANGEGQLLLIAAVAGLIVGPSLWRQLRRRPRLRLAFGLAFGTAVLSQMIDSVFGLGGETVVFWNKMAEVAEEALEMVAEAGFAGSLALAALHELPLVGKYEA